MKKNKLKFLLKKKKKSVTNLQELKEMVRMTRLMAGACLFKILFCIPRYVRFDSPLFDWHHRDWTIRR